MEATVIGIGGVILLLVFLAMRVPIAWSLGIVGFIGLLFLLPQEAALSSLFELVWGKADSYSLSVVPMFVFMGMLAMESGVGADIYDACNKWFGYLPGGLAIGTVAASGGFAAVTGSSIAAVATIGRVAIPEMKKYNYDPQLAVGSVAASGTLGVLIPPSIILVIYGILTELSIGQLLLAGIIPGVITMLLYGVMIYIRIRINPGLAARVKPFTWDEKFKSIPKVLPIVILFVAVLGSLYLGIATPTESAAVGCFISFIILLFKTKNRWEAFVKAIWGTVETVGMIFAIIVCVTIFVAFINLSQIPSLAAEMVVSLPWPNYLVLTLIMVLYIPLGMFLDPMGILFITMPIIFPAVMALGYDGIWFGVIITKLIEVGLVTPPLGLNVFVAKSVAPDMEVWDIFKGIGWFVFMDILTITILVLWPQLVTWLPAMVMK